LLNHLQPGPKQDKKVRDILGTQYAHLAGSSGPSSSATGTGKKTKKSKEEDFAMDENLQMLLGSEKDYYPFVAYTATWDLGAEK
jgi:hypothetical protein